MAVVQDMHRDSDDRQWPFDTFSSCNWRTYQMVLRNIKRFISNGSCRLNHDAYLILFFCFFTPNWWVVVVKGRLSWAVNLKKTVWTFQVWFKAASMQGKTARIWRAFGGERDHSRQKSRFCERKVARKPGMLPQTNLLKYMRSSWQFPFNRNLLSKENGDGVR